MDADRSFDSQSSGRTEPDKDGIHIIPDFSVAHTVSKGLRRNGDLLVFHECITIILECKPAPSRSEYNRDNRNHELRQSLDEAHKQLLLYLAVYFTKEPAAKSVIAVASSGSYWHWMKVEKHEVPSLYFMKRYGSARLSDLANVPVDDHEDYIRYFGLMDRWASLGSVYNLGKPESDQALMRMRAGDLISVLQECRCQLPASRKA
ncbi:hypothetical protein HGRIS_014778 [Hohenbuehelia grisea]|uniref:PD-(D/E)XK endonuclease-like domain-containing protein n=1 Tax=Hohenbuehelia grisea TaxID=104357 RepID=A0ABR3IQQ1_9AGAR